MKKILLILALTMSVPSLVLATDFTDTDQVYGWDGSDQFWQTWADHKTQLGALFEPKKGDDDNYVTDTEKSNLHAPGSDNQDLSGLEPSLGNPGTTGYVLSSTTAGVRSWIENGSGGTMTYPGAGIPVSTGSAWDTSYSTTTLATALDAIARTFTGTLYSGTSFVTAIQTILNELDGADDLAAGTGMTFDSTTLPGTTYLGVTANTYAPYLLTGYTSGSGTVAATDTPLQAIQKLNGNIAGKLATDGTAAAVTNATLTTAITVDTGAVRLIGNAGGASVVSIPNGTVNLPTGDVVNRTSSETLQNKTFGSGNVISTGTTVPVVLMIAASDETTDITEGPGKIKFRAPYAFTLTGVRASAITAPTGANIIIDVNETGTTSVLATKVTIETSEVTSVDATTQPVIGDPTIADNADMSIDFDQVGSTVAGAGVKVTLYGTRVLP